MQMYVFVYAWSFAETKNIAFNKPAFMLSERKQSAKRGTDGDAFSFFHSDMEADNSWWAVDLGEGGARVTAVRIVNRRSCGK